MNINFQFDQSVLDTLIGGAHALDMPRLNIQSLDQAHQFIRAYGYDPDKDEDMRKLWSYHRRAVTFIRGELLIGDEKIPEHVADPNQLKDISYLLIYASTYDQRQNSLQSWSCAILRVMHVLVHLDNDLFTRYSYEIQDQILRPFQSEVHTDPVSGTMLGAPSDPERIVLKKFDVKPFKTSNSSVTKLLVKPEAIAFSILDKVGVRFVTKHLFDVFRVLRYLVSSSLVSFPHGIPEQSNNTLYPVNLFLEVMEGLTKGMDLTPAEIDQILHDKITSEASRAQYREKLNLFSSRDYSFMKFISRRLVRVNVGVKEDNQTLSFFYPYEIQIIDYETYLKNLSGSASHDKYKERQRLKARLRVLGVKEQPFTEKKDETNE